MRRVLVGATFRIADGVLQPEREGWDGFVDALAPVLNELAAVRAAHARPPLPAP